jgi:hypothetical protein
MTATPKTQRDLFETAVIERMKESGFLEVEIRVECLTRCDDGYNDPVINAGWHYWNAALAADSGDEERPRYTTRRLHDEIRKAEERGRQEERECTTSPSDYYKRAAALLEKLRDEIGAGFGEGDIEHISEIVIARLRAWDKLDREDVKRKLSATPAPLPTPDYCYDPADWEFTCDWSEKDQVHGYGEALKVGEPLEIATLIRGPRKWVADVPVTWDADGDPDNTEIQWFDSEEDARAALTKKGGVEHA